MLSIDEKCHILEFTTTYADVLALTKQRNPSLTINKKFLNINAVMMTFGEKQGRKCIVNTES